MILTGLRARLMLLVFGALAPAMVLVVYIGYREHRFAESVIREQTIHQVQMVVQDQERLVAHTAEFLAALAHDAQVSQSTGAVCSAYLASVLERNPAFTVLGVVDLEGRVICSGLPFPAGMSLADRPYVRRTIATGGFAVGEYQIGRISHKASLAFGYPLRGSGGELLGVVFAGVTLQHLGEGYETTELPQGSLMVVLDGRGTVLARFPDRELGIGRAFQDAPLIGAMRSAKGGGTAESAGLDGVPRLYAYQALLEGLSGDVYVAVGVPTSVADATVRVQTLSSLGALLIVWIIVLALVWVGADALIGRPINALIAALKRLGSGDYATRSGLEDLGGEIGQLASGFDGMAKALQKRHFEVEQLKFAIDEHAIVSVAGLDGRITYVNDKFVKISQYSREELLGQDHRMLNSGYHGKPFFAELMGTITAGLPWHGVIRNRSKDGSFHWLATTIVPVIGTDGRHHYYISIRTEVTQIKQIEESLRQSEAKFRGLAETMSSAVIVQREGRTLYANRYAEVLTGFSNDELLTMDLIGIAHPESRQVIRERGAARMAGKPLSSSFEFRLNTKEGRERWVEMSGGVVNFDGQACLLGTFTDITERHAAQDALRHAHAELEQLVERRTEQLSAAKRDLERDMARRQQAEAELIERNTELTALNQRLSEARNQLMQSEKLASVGQLAAGVAHEINNPIGYVHSNLGALENYLGDLFRLMDAYQGAEAAMPPDHAAVRALQQLKSSVDLEFLKQDLPALMNESKEGITRVRKIVQDLKDFSRIDSGLEWQRSNLHQGLDSTLNIVASEIKYRADVNKRYGSIPDIECLPSQLNQVFMNLLVNAAHAIQGARGSITLSTGRIGNSVWVEFADTGSGIAKENLSRIFDPFFTTKPVGKGTGLGLSLSYGIVQKHHGRIEVASEPGKGTTFRVVLPIHQTERQSTIQAGQAAEPATVDLELIA